MRLTAFLILCFSSFTVCFAQQPKLMLPIGHTKDINSAQFSPDGKRIVTASSDETVKIWDVASGYLLLTLKGDSTGVTSAQYTRDGKKIMTLNWGLTIKIMDAETGKILHKINTSTDKWNTDQIKDAQISPDGSRILGLTTNHKAGIWDVSSGRLLFFLQEEINRKKDRFGFIQYSPDGKKILTLSLDSTVNIWDAESGKPVFEIPKKNDRLQSGSAQYSPDGKKIITVYLDNSVRMWDAETGQLLPEANVITKNTDYLEYSPDGKNFLTRFQYDTVKIWDGSSGRLLFYLQERANIILESNYSPDGKKILTRLSDNTVKIWDANTGQLLSVARGHTPSIDEIQYSPDGNKIISTGSFDYDKPASGWVWDVVSGKLLPPVKADTATRIINVVYSQDGKKVVTVTTTTSPREDGSWPEEVKLWDVASGKLRRTLTGAYFYKVKIKFSPDGKKMVSFSDDFGSPTIWDANTGSRLGELPYTYSRIISIQFSKDGKKILARSLNGSVQAEELRVWDIDTRKILKEWNQFNEGLNDAQISPDGKKMIIAFDSTIRIWDFTTLKPLFNLKHSGYVISIAYSPDGKKIVTNNLDSTINLWDANTGKLLTVSSGNTEITYSIQFSPDGKRIVTASLDKTEKIWDAEKGNFLAELQGHDGRVYHALFSPDGKSITTISADNTIKKWDAATGQCLYTFFAVDKDDYLVTDNDNHYDGTEAARKLLYFVCGTEIVSIDQVKDQLWVPGLAERINKGDSINAKSLSDLDICGLTPEVEDISGNTNEYHFTIKPRRGGLGETNVTINGALTSGYQPEELTKNGDIYELKVNKEKINPFFSDGTMNKITVKAYTADNTISSREVTINIDKTAPPAVPPNLYAVMVGVSDYKGETLDLNYAAIDATDISTTVANAAKKLLNTEGNNHVFMYNLTTAKEHYLLPEKISIKKTLEDIGKKATANDILLIFLSGHGVMEGEKKQFYFLTADASPNSLSSITDIAEVGISTAELTEWIKPQNMKAQKRILILDACYSGQAIKDFVNMGNEGQGFLAAKGDDKSQQIKAIDKLNEKSGLFILSASASSQKAYESDSYGHGYLTYSLLKAIKQQPDILVDGGLLNVSRWFNAAEKTVSDLAKEDRNKQEPQIVTNTDFNIGLVDDEVMGKIVLSAGKPLFAASNFQNADETIMSDDLGLNKLIDKQLNQIAAKGAEAVITYTGSSNSPDAYTLSGRYSIKGNNISLKIIIRNSKEIKQRLVLTGTKDKLDNLVEAVVEKAAEWATGKK